MLIRAQPLDTKTCEKYKSQSKESETMTEQNIKSQRIGKWFDDWLNDDEKYKIHLKTRIDWIWRDIKGKYQDLKYVFRNHFKWRKTINNLRPWEGFSGLIQVMQTHLRDYIETEIRHGHAQEEYKNQKINTAKEMVELLERMEEPNDYYDRHREAVNAKYPEYKSLITEYQNGGISFNGCFIAQGNGWTGTESGKDPRTGYFEFVNGSFELASSPDPNETSRLLNELARYNGEVESAYEFAEYESDKDFERLSILLKENLYSWWD